MLRRKKKPVINPNTTDTIVGEGSVFEGRIKCQASLRIEGQLIGDVDCLGDVTVGENGKIRSNITARDVIIAGNVNGNVTTRGKLTITASGELQGNISAHSFIIEEGGIFQGSSKMDQKQSGTQSEAGSSGNSQGNGNGNGNQGKLGNPGNGSIAL